MFAAVGGDGFLITGKCAGIAEVVSLGDYGYTVLISV
jgi:hypothetical protein